MPEPRGWWPSGDGICARSTVAVAWCVRRRLVMHRRDLRTGGVYAQAVCGLGWQGKRNAISLGVGAWCDACNAGNPAIGQGFTAQPAQCE
eukprot:6199850-Pleurochrysis_carterae.AAC.2